MNFDANQVQICLRSRSIFGQNLFIQNIMRYLILFLFSILLFTACQKAEQKQTASTEAKRYKLEGKVVSVDKANKKAEIDHKAIEGYMDAMTMSFPIHADWVWDELKPGAEIKAELVVDESAKEPYLARKHRHHRRAESRSARAAGQ